MMSKAPPGLTVKIVRWMFRILGALGIADVVVLDAGGPGSGRAWLTSLPRRDEAIFCPADRP